MRLFRYPLDLLLSFFVLLNIMSLMADWVHPHRQNAAGVLDEYLASVGGRDTILEEGNTAMKTKKRGRPSSGTPVNGTKRRRNESHPASASPPASARAWKPPQGSWEDAVESIDACHDENTGKLIVYLTWKTGHKTQHDTKVIYARCPQKVGNTTVQDNLSNNCSLPALLAQILTQFPIYLPRRFWSWGY